MPATLNWRQSRTFTQTVRVWRYQEAIAADGEPAKAWSIAHAELYGHIYTKPSQFALAGAMIPAEGDNLFTMDLWSFHADEEILESDVIECTGGHSRLVGAYWKLRGEAQLRTWNTNSQTAVYESARLSGPPEGIG